MQRVIVKDKKPLMALLAYFSALFALFFVADTALAGSLGDVAENVTESMSNVAKLITAASYVAGVGFAMAGMLKLKAHKDNPQQVPLSQPFVLIIIAVGLLFLPSLIDTAGETIFKGGSRATAEGGGLE